MKFTIPDGIVVVPRKDAPVHRTPKLWPLGTLYKHVASGTVFRFLSLGGRWDPHYGICTSDGILTRDGFQYGAAKPSPTVSHKDKNGAVTKLVEYIEQGTICGRKPG